MQLIYLTDFGSHVYGTNLPTSDTDIKGIFFPTAEEILLQRAVGTKVHTTKADSSAKNGPEDVDTELYSLHRYMKLLLEGQTVSIDMLFTPEKHWRKQGVDTFWWNYIRENKRRFLHSGTTSFVGYCRTQANRYGIKGSRVAAVRRVILYLERLQNPYYRLANLAFLHDPDFFKDQEHIGIVHIENKKGVIEPFLEVCNRKVSMTATVKYALDVFKKIFDEYGARALQAEKNEGCDWKALSHAVRICGQAQELLLTGHITFPRPDRDILLAIRKGERPYKEVAELIEQGIVDLDLIKAKSTLRAEPDHDFADDIVCSAYAGVVSRANV